ncbi:uncharacterized protein B0H18DRAFT_541674 [Fomitopsis serialis]|uniref:uncharacterized protein n=1 Tax=Fomitopsis serialis TaxID=139415 RepID=UPI00200844EB|nr:uncharacterized protein B0H18DRAFT_541674 [Neoantrodia serialis]KAH9921611.1 hypothetical protein B0H18DRAFT_541674 [Neoantrodia serialis]
MTTLKGPVDMSRRKAELMDIASGLGLSTVGNKKTLIQQITEYLGNHDDLCLDPKFQGLFAYRPDTKIASGGRSQTKQGSKTSADKVNEDDTAAQASQEKTATGSVPYKYVTYESAHRLVRAGKTLQSLQISTDPPPRFTRLQSGTSKIGGNSGGGPAVIRLANEAAISTRDDSSLSPMSSPAVLPQDIGSEPEGGDISAVEVEELAPTDIQPADLPHTPPKWPVGLPSTVDNIGPKQDIVVAFHRTSGDAVQSTLEVCVKEGRGISLVRSQAADGTTLYTARLSELLPAAINQASPVKAAGGRLYRAGFSTESSKVSLGSVKSVVEGNGHQFEYNRVDLYKLQRTTDGDSLLCNVYLDGTTVVGQDSKDHASSAMQADKIAALDIPASLQKDAHPAPDMVSRTQNTSGTDKDFLGYLRELLDAPSKPWPRANSIGVILKRRLAVIHAMETLDSRGWSQSTGGYVVADDEDTPFAGRKFTKQTVYEALHIKHSNASDDARLFAAQDLKKLSRVRAWMADPEGKYSNDFSDMTVAEFKRYKEKALTQKMSVEKEEYRKDQKGKKRADRSDSEGESSGYLRHEPKRTRKSIGMDSSDLDV